jgi:hypothetical protein
MISLLSIISTLSLPGCSSAPAYPTDCKSPGSDVANGILKFFEFIETGTETQVASVAGDSVSVTDSAGNNTVYHFLSPGENRLIGVTFENLRSAVKSLGFRSAHQVGGSIVLPTNQNNYIADVDGHAVEFVSSNGRVSALFAVNDQERANARNHCKNAY